jgi:hypothetical protein
MTENAFYPLFLLAALAVVRHLEQPSARRAAVAMAVTVVAALAAGSMRRDSSRGGEPSSRAAQPRP